MTIFFSFRELHQIFLIKEIRKDELGRNILARLIRSFNITIVTSVIYGS